MNHYDAADDTMLFCIEALKASHKSGAKYLEGIHTTYRRQRMTEELKHETTGKTVSRPAIQRAGDIAFSNPVNSKNEGTIKLWIKELFAFAVVIAFVYAAAVFAASFNPLYGPPPTTIQN